MATKVGIVVPSGDMVHARFAVALCSLIQSATGDGIETVLINPRSALISTGRQMGVDAALKRNCSHILWLDSDMIFPHYTLDYLLEVEAEVIGATYVRRQLPATLTHRELNGIEPFVGNGVREVETLPSGVLLVETSVYEKMERPYYRCSYENGREIGEDVWFCRNAGVPIYLHADLSKEVGHIGSYTHTVRDLEMEVLNGGSV